MEEQKTCSPRPDEGYQRALATLGDNLSLLPSICKGTCAVVFAPHIAAGVTAAEYLAARVGEAGARAISDNERRYFESSGAYCEVRFQVTTHGPTFTMWGNIPFDVMADAVAFARDEQRAYHGHSRVATTPAGFRLTSTPATNVPPRQ